MPMFTVSTICNVYSIPESRSTVDSNNNVKNFYTFRAWARINRENSYWFNVFVRTGLFESIMPFVKPKAVLYLSGDFRIDKNQNNSQDFRYVTIYPSYMKIVRYAPSPEALERYKLQQLEKLQPKPYPTHSLPPNALHTQSQQQQPKPQPQQQQPKPTQSQTYSQPSFINQSQPNNPHHFDDSECPF